MCNLVRVCVLFIILVATAAVPAEATLPGANGRIAYVEGCCSILSVYSIDSDGTDKVKLTDPHVLEIVLSPTWRPNGKMIALSAIAWAPSGATRVSSFEIYRMRADGSRVRRVTDTRKLESDPAWSPDGQHIAFARGEERWSDDLFLIHPDGTGLERLTRTRRGEGAPAWSPDGQHIAFTRGGRYSSDLFLMHPDGTGLERLTRTEDWEYDPQWFPDGSKLVYWIETDRDANWNSSVWTIDPVTKATTPVLNDPAIDERYPTISPDGTKMAWVRGMPDPDPEVGEVSELIVSDLDGSNALVLDTCQLNCGFSGMEWNRA